MFALWRTVQEPHEQFFNYIVCDKKNKRWRHHIGHSWVRARALTPYRSTDVLCRENNNNWISVMYHKFLSFDFFPIISSLQHTLFALYDYLLAGFCVRVRGCLCEIEGTENHIGDEKRKEMKRRKKRDRMATTHMSPSDVSVRSHICLCVSRIALSVNHCRAFVHFYFCCVYTWFG